MDSPLTQWPQRQVEHSKIQTWPLATRDAVNIAYALFVLIFICIPVSRTGQESDDVMRTGFHFWGLEENL